MTEQTIMIFVFNADTLLLFRRHNTWFGNNQFAVPGGLVDKNESPENAARRELLEETGLIISIDSLSKLPVRQTKHEYRLYENFYFYTHQWAGELVNNEPERHSELNWYPCSDLPKETMPLVRDILAEITQ